MKNLIGNTQFRISKLNSIINTPIKSIQEDLSQLYDVLSHDDDDQL